ncbi:Flp pilus assembly protein CpaB [Devosia sp.]|uniref:Flp pilus assembly protein CpaB n=1 Tax=Devosia sp. TaxID=1871048 RepID=UPI0035B13FCA
MRASRLILLLVALLAGGLAAFLATRSDTPEQVVVEGPTKVVEEAKEQILVAKLPIGVGQRLTEETIEWQDWPELAVRPEYVTKTALPDALTEMNGAVARFEFFPGEPIMQQKLVRSDQGYLSAVLAKGMRAVSVQVSAASASGGYIMPNDRVDLVLSRPGTSGTVSETILSNIKVLAIGLRLGEAGTTGETPDPEDPRSSVFQDSAIATLELDPAQGELVINSSRIGTLSLVLRSIADYAQASGEVRQQNSGVNRAIRLIRFGRDVDVMSSRQADAAVDNASYDETANESADTAVDQ